MQTQSTSLFTPVDKTVVNELTKEVKETLAFDYNNSHRKTFSAAELWNIQRQHRSTNQKRRFL